MRQARILIVFVIADNCNPILIMTALVEPSASNCPAATIVTATPSLLQLLSLRLPPPGSRHAVTTSMTTLPPPLLP
jgi:hypothetical protein